MLTSRRFSCRILTIRFIFISIWLTNLIKLSYTQYYVHLCKLFKYILNIYYWRLFNQINDTWVWMLSQVGYSSGPSVIILHDDLSKFVKTVVYTLNNDLEARLHISSFTFTIRHFSTIFVQDLFNKN